MIKWPEKLKNGREAGKLPGIGPSISSKLDERLRRHREETGIVDEIPDGAVIYGIDEEENESSELPSVALATGKASKRAKAKKIAKEYVPAFRSAPYSVLIALLLHLHQDPQNGPSNKSELILKAQGYSTSPLNDGQFPSINGALKILEEKDLISRTGNPPHFILTVKGAELAEKLWEKGEKRPSQNCLSPLQNRNRLISSDAINRTVGMDTETSPLELFTWPEGSFEIILLVDVREIRSREDRNYLTERLSQLGIKSEVRNLELGDFIWIARKISGTSGKLNAGEANIWTDTEEIVLDTLIERKREDDLIASICDGRFREQKHRIARSQLSSTFYLVERGGNAVAHEFLGGGEERLLAATLQCQLIDGLMYRQTGGLDESIVFLVSLHKQLKSTYGAARISACALKASQFNYSRFPHQFADLKDLAPNSTVLLNYTAYALLNAKSTNQSSSDIFLRQLLTIKGLTFDKACSILRKYPTPFALYHFYESLHELAKKEAFKEFIGEKGKKFGSALSKKIYEVFGRK